MDALAARVPAYLGELAALLPEPLLPEPLLMLAGGLVIEGLLGYPDAVFRRIGHPVSWIGALIARLDAALNDERMGDGQRRLAGIAALAAVASVAFTAGGLLTALAALLPMGWLIELLVLALLLAPGSLHRHVAAVAAALEGKGTGDSPLTAARQAVARIVGRDKEALDEAGVARAAIESLSENASDGVVAPAFWYLVAGLPGLLVYKAVSTADSMIGYRTPRHEAFGWASARSDDVLNLIPARLTALGIAAAALVSPRASGTAALRTGWSDASLHASPNAGWPEAAMAGALGLALGGPKRYGGAEEPGPWFGDGRAAAEAADIRRALALIWRSYAMLLLLCLALAMMPL